MLTAVLLAALGATEPGFDVRPCAPGTVQAPAVRALLPQDEDWSAAGDSTPAYKHQTWGANANITTSFGLDARLHVEHFRNEAFGAIPGGDESIFLRLTPWASVTFNDRVRLYGALKHGSVAGREASTPAAIDDPLDLHQGFVEFALGDMVGQSRNDLLVRLGRQELHYGRGRVIALRAGRIMRDDYDGGLVRYRNGAWVTDAFGFYAVEDGDDMFDNGTDDSASFSGLYSSGVIQGLNVDLYTVRWRRDEMTTTAGLSEVIRNYAGARFSGTAGEHWSWDVEATVQFGTVDATNEDLRGFQISGRIARAFSDMPGAPTPTLEFLYTTGDDDPSDGRIDTFLAPAASGLVYEDVTQPLGPGNLAWVKASVPFQAGSRLRVAPYVHAYWRVESQDALYTLFNTQLLPANTGNGDFVGVDIGFTARLSLTEHLSAFAYAGHFEPGDVFEETTRDVSGGNAILGLAYRY